MIAIRRCVFTENTYKGLNFQHVNPGVPARLQTQPERISWLFNKGKLVCRWMYVTELHANGQSYGGESRQLYRREVDDFDQQSTSSRGPPRSHTKSTHHGSTMVRQRTLGDGFCGCGGASKGAEMAGFKILWGLDHDKFAMSAYRKNFPEAMHLEEDAQDFATQIRRSVHGCDHVHMSCPCCYWSQVQ